MKVIRYVIWGFLWLAVAVFGFTASALSHDNTPGRFEEMLANFPAGLAMMIGVCGVIGVAYCAIALGKGNATSLQRLKVGHIYVLIGRVNEISVICHVKSGDRAIIETFAKEFSEVTDNDQFVWTKGENVAGKTIFKARRLTQESPPPIPQKTPRIPAGCDLI